jgi:cyclin-dependent kinase 7
MCRTDCRWYRPPELLWGSRYYSPAVDMWSMGTIFVELVLRVPFLAGDTDMDQLKKTFHAMGSPSEEEWPVCPCLSCHINAQGHTTLPDYHSPQPFPRNPWWNLISSIGPEGQNLARELLKYDPRARLSARQVRVHS